MSNNCPTCGHSRTIWRRVMTIRKILRKCQVDLAYFLIPIVVVGILCFIAGGVVFK